MINGRSAAAISSATAAIASGCGAARSIGQSRGSKNALREVVGVGLDVLRQRDHDRAGLDRAGEHAHRLRQRGQQLLRAA